MTDEVTRASSGDGLGYLAEVLRATRDAAAAAYERLNALPAPSAIVQELLRVGVRGRRSSAFTCPVARYVAREAQRALVDGGLVDVVARVAFCPATDLGRRGDWWPRLHVISIQRSSSVARYDLERASFALVEFTERFDRQLYPMLVAREENETT